MFKFSGGFPLLVDMINYCNKRLRVVRFEVLYTPYMHMNAEVYICTKY